MLKLAAAATAGTAAATTTAEAAAAATTAETATARTAAATQTPNKLMGNPVHTIEYFTAAQAQFSGPFYGLVTEFLGRVKLRH